MTIGTLNELKISPNVHSAGAGASKTVNQRFEHIDALRGIAVLAVIALHTSNYSPPFYNAFNSIIKNGQHGVQLFYVISAFTLFLSLSTRSTSLRSFFLRRFFRIAPLFYCAVAFYLWRDGLGPRQFLGDAPSITSWNILATLTFTNGLNPYWINSVVPGGWSIAIEMVFYLFVPLLYKKINSLDRAVTFTFVTLLLSVLIAKIGSRYILITDRVLWQQFLYFWLPNQIPIFGIGFVLFFLHQKIVDPSTRIYNPKAKSVLMLFISSFLCLAFVFGDLKLIPSHFLFGLSFLILIIALSFYKPKILVNKFTTYMGVISYSVYLTHFLVLPFSQSFAEEASKYVYLPAVSRFVLTLCVEVIGTAIVSSATYRLVEIPGQKFGYFIARFLAD